MEAFEIYTLGSGFYLEKVFNALRLVFASGFNDILKTAAITSILILALRASVTNDFKETVKWILGVVVLTSLFLSTKAKVIIIEQLPNNSGMIPAARMVEDVPWGLAMIGSTTSIVGKTLMEKFDVSFAGATNNEGYQKTGIMFGSKIVEDASRIKISSPSLRNVMVKFYRQCMIPDLKMGHNRANGYSFDELSESDDITAFLKNHASKARNIYVDAVVTKRVKKEGAFGKLLGSYTNKQSTEKGYYSCNQAAHMIGDMIEFEVESNMSQLSSSFISQFTGQKNNVVEKNAFYKSILQNNYSKFLETSKDASSILMQNVMINSIRDSASSVANTYGQFSTEEMSKSSFYSVSQVFQRFIPIIRAVFECLFYGVSPIVLILMVTPIGLDVLKNYAFSFVYLQMWPPMYSILYSITEAWGSMSASGLKLNMRFLPQIESINADISMVSGYMLALIPVLSMFVTKGLVASIGNMATSMMYIPQTAAVQSAEQAVRGNYSFGNTSIDTHSYNNLSANKHDDNYQWMSGMKSFALPSGASMKSFADGRVGLDASGAMSNLGGQVSIGWNKAIGSSLNESENHAQNEVERHSKDYTESASAGMSKMLGYNSNYSKGTSAYESINQSLTTDQRSSFDYVRGVTDRIAKDNNISSEDALRMSAGINVGIPFTEIGIGMQGYSTSQLRQAWSQTQDAMHDKRFSESLNQVESIGKTKSIQTQDSVSRDALNSIKSDFNKASNASSSHSASMDKLYSIQTAKTNYENSGSNFDKQFTNMFTEEYVNKYGVGAFEKLVRENPNNIDAMVKSFIKEKGLVERLTIGEVEHQKDYGLNNRDLLNIENAASANNIDLNASSGEFIGQSSQKSEVLDNRFSNSQRNFAKQNDKASQQISSSEDSLSNTYSMRKEENEKELNQLASEKAFNRIKKEASNE
jgi:conjugal transfer mating pair stabilization protein TraG